jgi:hypothetical protein
LEKIEPVFSPQEHPTPQAEDTPVGVAESDLDQLPRTQELEDLAGCPLGRAIERYLALRYPHLKELEDLILAEAGYLLSSDLGRQLLVVDPGEFVEAAVRRAVITVAETRVALRQAVRSRAASAKESSLPEPKSEPVPPLDAQ